MSIFWLHGSNTSTVGTSSDHAEVASVEPDCVLDLASGNVHLDTVVNPDSRVGEANGPSIRRVQEGDILGSSLDLSDAAQLVLGLGPELAIDLDQALLTDSLDLLHGEGILQTVPQEQSYGQRLSLFVGS